MNCSARKAAVNQGRWWFMLAGVDLSNSSSPAMNTCSHHVASKHCH